MTDSADGLEPRLQTPSQLPHTLLNISYHFESLHQLKALWRKKKSSVSFANSLQLSAVTWNQRNGQGKERSYIRGNPVNLSNSTISYVMLQAVRNDCRSKE